MTLHTHDQWHGSNFEWLTPEWIFTALGVRFDLDPCSPVDRVTHVPCDRMCTMDDDGLKQDWFGRVWLNPPFGTANGVHQWLHRFYDHGNGIGIIRADISTSWWHDYINKSLVIVMPRGRVRYVNNNPGQEKAKGRPGFAGVLFSAGEECGDILFERSKQIGVPWQRVTAKPDQ